MLSEFKKYDSDNPIEWPRGKYDGKAVFNVALTLVKDMLEDVDVTPEGNYDPVVILLSSNEVSPDFEAALAEFNKDGRFSNVQKIGIAGVGYDGKYYGRYYGQNGGIAQIEQLIGPQFSGVFSDRCNGDAMIESYIPQVLSEFAGENVVVYLSDAKGDGWYAKGTYRDTETKDNYTWFCPVLNMIELRYTQDEKEWAKKIDEGEDGNRLERVLKEKYGGML